MNKQDYTNSKGAVVELLLVLIVAVILLVGVFVYASKSATPTPVGDTTPVVEENEAPTPTGFGTISDPTPIPTAFPTESLLKTDSGDSTIDEAASDINQLIAELNGLDTVETELNLPNVDFSLSF